MPPKPRSVRNVPSTPAIYARISLDRTGEGLGVQRQIDLCREECKRLGWPEPKVYSDNDISAKSGRRRPGFEALLADIGAGAVDGLMAWHLDRVLRRVLDLERVLDAIEAQRTPINVVFLQAGEIDLTTASGRMLARILASVAAGESELKAERISAQRRQAAESGKAHGALGYGYDVDRQIIPEEAAIIREVATRVVDGESLYAIATDLNERGVPTPGGGRWDARRVAKTVKKGERAEVCALIEAARGAKPLKPTKVAALLNDAGGVRADGEPWTTFDLKALFGSSEETTADWLKHLGSSEHGLSDSDIAKMLTAAAVPADPTFWRAANLRSMIRRGSLCGWREHSPGERGGRGVLVAEGDWAPILPRSVIEDVRKVTDRPGARGPGREPRYLLATTLKCGKCGSSMGGSPDGRGGHRYACSKQPGLQGRCGGLTIAGHEVDSAITGLVKKVLADGRVRAGTKKMGTTDEAVKAAEKELADITALREEYAEEAASGDLSAAEYKIIREGLKARERAAAAVLGSWAPPTRIALRDIPTKRPEIEQWWESASMSRKREVVRGLIDHITIAPTQNGKGSNRFDPTRIGEPVWLV